MTYGPFPTHSRPEPVSQSQESRHDTTDALGRAHTTTFSLGPRRRICRSFLVFVPDRSGGPVVRGPTDGVSRRDPLPSEPPTMTHIPTFRGVTHRPNTNLESDYQGIQPRAYVHVSECRDGTCPSLYQVGLYEIESLFRPLRPPILRRDW